MAAPSDLPRVTYSNIGADFEPLHAWLDQALAQFRAGLGREWPNLIAGKPDRVGEPYEVRSPIDRELVIGHFFDAGADAVARAVEAAGNAFAKWGATPWPERVQRMREFAAAIDRRKYDLAMAALYEVGKSRLEAVGEAEEAVDLVRYYCDEMERNDGYERRMSRAVEQEETVCTMRPVGVFAVISPFNFPVALACNMLGGCLVTGNTAVFKPSPGAGLTASLLLECAQASGLPDGVLNLVCGEQAGPRVVDARGIDGFAFTGSHEVGMEIFRKMASGPWARPLIVEMGGKNPAYVSASAELDVAAEGVMRSAFGLQGEKCSACSVAYVERAVYDEFLERLGEKTAALVVDTPENRAAFVGPVIDADAVARFERAVEEARQAGRLVCGGKRITDAAHERGNFVQPTVVADLPAEHWLNREEQFMPFLSVQPVDTLEEGIERGNRILYGLTAGIYAGRQEELDYFLGHAQAGVLYANRRSGATTGAWPGYQTFAGWKGSGVDGKGGLGPWYLPRFMREQSHTIMHAGKH